MALIVTNLKICSTLMVNIFISVMRLFNFLFLRAEGHWRYVYLQSFFWIKFCRTKNHPIQKFCFYHLVQFFGLIRISLRAFFQSCNLSWLLMLEMEFRLKLSLINFLSLIQCLFWLFIQMVKANFVTIWLSPPPPKKKNHSNSSNTPCFCVQFE